MWNCPSPSCRPGSHPEDRAINSGPYMMTLKYDEGPTRNILDSLQRCLVFTVIYHHHPLEIGLTIEALSNNKNVRCHIFLIA